MVHGGCVGVYIWDGEGKLAAFTDSSWAVPFLWGFVEVAVVSLSPESLWCGRGLMAAAFWGYYNFNTYVGLFWGNICVWASGLLGHDTFLSFSVSMVPAGSDGSRPPQTRSPFFLFLRFMIWLSAQQKWNPKQAAHGVALLTFHFLFSEPISPSSLTLWVHHVSSLYTFQPMFTILFSTKSNVICMLEWKPKQMRRSVGLGTPTTAFGVSTTV